MKPKNFPARKLRRQQRAQQINDAAALLNARAIKSKKQRGKPLRRDVETPKGREEV